MTPITVIVPQPILLPRGMTLSGAMRCQGMTARHLALAVGVHPSRISRWAAGENIPARHLRAVSDALRIPVEDLLPVSAPAEQDRAA